ncbi:hypothetical protein XENOCAPTIV_002927 [Xenoophorus captivus]|uniref:Uncharacterized protein n=1 Tax=Xenoophorus captivus TaxID=1517983 RepID=A0ABV0RQ84_9TELE
MIWVRAHTYKHSCAHIHPAANTPLRYVVCFFGKLSLHISCHCLLKYFYFPDLNMLIRPQLSFRSTRYSLASTHCQISASPSLFQLLCVCATKQKQDNRTKFSHQVFCVSD